MLLASVTIRTPVAKRLKRDIKYGWDTRVNKKTKVLRVNCQWCYIPYVKNAVPYFVRQCKVSSKVWKFLLLFLDYLWCLCYLERIDDNDPGYEHDRWIKRETRQKVWKSYVQIVGTTRIWIKYETTLNKQVCTLYLASYWSYKASARAAYFLMAVYKKIEAIQSSGLCLHTPARNFTRGLWAPYGQCLVLQSYSVVSGRVQYRPWLDEALVCLCHSTGGVLWTSATG